jgi:branched-subunit amino acid aminotransferase/4-amino-4-deoxychorismate lyase
MELMPLVSVDGRPVGTGRPGPLTEWLAALYRDLVARETSRATAA